MGIIKETLGRSVEIDGRRRTGVDHSGVIKAGHTLLGRRNPGRGYRCWLGPGARAAGKTKTKNSTKTKWTAHAWSPCHRSYFLFWSLRLSIFLFFLTHKASLLLIRFGRECIVWMMIRWNKLYTIYSIGVCKERTNRRNDWEDPPSSADSGCSSLRGRLINYSNREGFPFHW